MIGNMKKVFLHRDQDVELMSFQTPDLLAPPKTHVPRKYV